MIDSETAGRRMIFIGLLMLIVVLLAIINLEVTLTFIAGVWLAVTGLLLFIGTAEWMTGT